MGGVSLLSARRPAGLWAALLLLPLWAHPVVDTDGDGLSDEDEKHKYFTSPTNRSTAGNGVPDGDWTQRRQFTTSIRAVLRVLKPCMAGTNADPFQDSAVLADHGQTVDLECIAYLHHHGLEGARLPDLRLKRRERRVFSRLPENPDWRRDNAAMAEWLRPSRACNWDEALRAQISAELRADGIEVEPLSDTDLVEWVVAWLWERSECRTTAGLPYLFSFQKKKVALPASTYALYARNNPLPFPEWRSPLDPEWKAYAEIAFDGKRMWAAHRYDWGMGWCIYVATVLRALGIPTRFAQFVPMVNPARPSELAYLEKALRPAPVRDFLLQSSRGTYAMDMLQEPWQVVTMNEVWVGGRWVLLHLPRSGSGVNFPATPMQAGLTPGFLLRIHTFADPTALDYASTWGSKAAGSLKVPSIPGATPWQLLSLSPQVGRHSRLIINELTNQDDWDALDVEPSAARFPPPGGGALEPATEENADRMPLIHRLPLELEALAQARREGLFAGQFPTAFRIPTHLSSRLHFEVHPAQFPNRAYPALPEAGPSTTKESPPPYVFFPDAAGPQPGPRAKAREGTNPAAGPVAPPTIAPGSTNQSAWTIVDAFWYESDKRPLPMPPALSAQGGALFLLKVRRPTPAGGDDFLRACSRRFRLERDGETIPARLLPVYWQDYFACSISAADVLRMKPGAAYRLAAVNEPGAGIWRVAEGLMLQRP
jgi:hypothetical protein